MIVRLWVNEKYKIPALAILSIVAIYILQPALPIRYLDFWLPTTALLLTILVWITIQPTGIQSLRKNLPGLLLSILVVVAFAGLRYINWDRFLLPSSPPPISGIFFLLILFASIGLLANQIRNRSILLGAFLALIILVFVVIKTPFLAGFASSTFRALNQQAVDLASPLDIRWLGFSYLAFRLLHTIRDRQSGKTIDVPFLNYLVYALFFPAYTAGPIDRLERFSKDLHRPAGKWQTDFLDGGKRLALGLVKKFVLADSLALIAINQVNAVQVNQAGWLWVLLYAYSLQIYLDFSGYTDIAIGLGKLVGIHLPENFNQPYLKPNLTMFWNNWHITLTQWFRGYYFNPLARWLRSRSVPVQQYVVILIGQISTMVLIGMWHGVTLNFLVWGLWHGIGLFIQNRWSEWVRGSLMQRMPSGLREGYGNTLFYVLGIFVTFHYVSLGWLWFAISDPGISMTALRRLFGGG